MRRIIILRPGALGDALLALPALWALRATWPQAHITYISRADILPLVASSRLADSVYSYDLPSWATLWSDASTPDALLRATFAGADALVAWVDDGDGTLRRTASALGVGAVVTAAGRPPVETSEHAARYLLRTLTPLGVVRASGGVDALTTAAPQMRPSSAAVDDAARCWRALGLPEQRVVALHPGSGGARKCWPADRYATLAMTLRAHGYFPAVIEGPADGPAVSALLGALPPSLAPPVLREAPVERLAAFIARCDGYVGNDSGVTHLAALVGAPTLALFGPTDPAQWSPVGRCVHILRAGEARLVPMNTLPAARVEAELLRMLET